MICTWCEEGNPRIRSSVSEAFVHTDTPVGRRVCCADLVLKRDYCIDPICGHEVCGHEISIGTQQRGICLVDGCKCRSVRHPDYDDLWDEIERLRALINIPHTDDFLKAVPLEAAHQIERWGSDHDEGKEPSDWFWLIGYLAGKACTAAIKGDIEKAKHHTISTAAAMLNWFRRLNGDDQSVRPGVEAPKMYE